ncbi:ribose-phosphate pyrophosphokinase [Candidatus Sumerlaeota bacterium]|nr:ribose-phosphate pyrophosphokinase [Candidatus Sumerlaeota bacterium]
MYPAPAIEKGPIVFGGTASVHLSREVCAHLKIEEGKVEVQRFSDGETAVKILNNVRGADTYVIQSTCTPVNDNLMELLLTIDALHRASAERINVIVPYYGYARQDRKDQGRVALSAKVVANLLVASGADRVVCLDLHSAQIQGFFDIPVDHLIATPVLVDYIKTHNLVDKDTVVVSPDVGNVKRARNYATALDAPLVIVDKRRPKPNVSEVMNIIGEVKGKRCFIFDDLIDTAGTLCNAAEALIEEGAKSVYACATHAVLSGKARERLSGSVIEKVIVTNSILQTNGKTLSKLEIVSIAPLLAEAIHRIHCRLSISELFD